MGNNTSSTTSNPSWERYQIQRVERSPYSIKFFLDSNVKYSNGYFNYVNCDNVYPYYDIEAGDLIEVNWYRSEDYNSSHEFTGSDNLRVIRFIQKLREYAYEVDDRSGRELYRISRASGTFIVERKTERQGNLMVEYIEKVRMADGEITARIQSWTYNRAI